MSPERSLWFQRRQPGRKHAEAIFSVIDRHDTPLVGSPDVTADEVRDEAFRTGLHLTNDAGWSATPPARTSPRRGPYRRVGMRAMVAIDVWQSPIPDDRTRRPASCGSPVGLVPHLVRATSPGSSGI